ncbi:MAG: ABC transporter ATP-binding protein, partial [candidate division NC10 bacterium]
MALLEVTGLKKWFPVESGFFATLTGRSSGRLLRAVDGISLRIEEQEGFGLAGESGAGKSVTGELLVRLQQPTAGQIVFKGQEVTAISGSALRQFRREVQMIFQDPYESLNPRFTVMSAVMEPLRIHGIGDREARVVQALERAELRPVDKYLTRYPHQLSGGERQRVAIARAMVLEPRFVVADEPTSMLDVSVRAGVLNLLRALQEELGLSLLFISHDFSTIRYLCRRTAIMYLGRIVEEGETGQILTRPLHPYTRELLAAIPVPDPDAHRRRTTLKGEIPNPIDLPVGCRFQGRCPYRMKICEEVEPDLIEV